MNNITAISNLKIRASYGITGNFQIGNYDHIARIGISNYILGPASGQLTNGSAPANLSNADLGWERSKMFDLGIDLGLFQQRLNLEIDLYDKTTSDLLLNLPVPYSSGFRMARQNIGKVNNKGVEATLSMQNEFGKFDASNIADRFGGWAKAHERAGLNLARHQKSIRLNDDELFLNLEEVWTKLGQQPIQFRTSHLAYHSLRIHSRSFPLLNIQR